MAHAIHVVLLAVVLAVPTVSRAQEADLDQDGIPNAEDDDRDGDGVPNDDDDCDDDAPLWDVNNDGCDDTHDLLDLLDHLVGEARGTHASPPDDIGPPGGGPRGGGGPHGGGPRRGGPRRGPGPRSGTSGGGTVVVGAPVVRPSGRGPLPPIDRTAVVSYGDYRHVRLLVIGGASDVEYCVPAGTALNGSSTREQPLVVMETACFTVQARRVAWVELATICNGNMHAGPAHVIPTAGRRLSLGALDGRLVRALDAARVFTSPVGAVQAAVWIVNAERAGVRRPRDVTDEMAAQLEPVLRVLRE